MSRESTSRRWPPERSEREGSESLRRYWAPAVGWSLVLAAAFYARGEADVALSLAVVALALAALGWITRPASRPAAPGLRDKTDTEASALLLLTRDAALAHEAYSSLQGRRIPCRLDEEEREHPASAGTPLLRLAVPHEVEDEARAALAGLFRTPPEPPRGRGRSILRWRGFRLLAGAFVAVAILQSLVASVWLIGKVLRSIFGEG